MTGATTKPQRVHRGGRPVGAYGIKRRQQMLVASYVKALGGSVTDLQRQAVENAARLRTICESAQRNILENGAQSANQLLALAKLEAQAADAIRALKIPEAA